jgi:uncharacterized protein
MLDVIRSYAPQTIFWIAFSVFLTSTGKGGFPAGPVAMSLLVLVFPGQTETARTAVAFMLPLLILMDIFGFILYRKHILWKKLLPLIPGTLAGVALATILFVSKENSFIYISDTWFRLFLGFLGFSFVVYRALKSWLIRRIEKMGTGRGIASAGVFGFLAGVVSTMSNSAAPLIQMYLLPRKPKKMNFAATVVAFFFFLNMLKMVPFSLMGRIEVKNLLLGVWMLPVIPFGVAAGYGLVRIMKERHYTVLIYAALTVTSTLLIVRSVM